MIDAQGIQHCGLDIVNVHGILHNTVAIVISLADRTAALDAAAGHPHGEATWVMVAAIVGRREFALAVDGTPEFTTPNHQRIVEHAALLQVLNQGG